MEIGWRGMDTDPFLLHLSSPPASPEHDRARHEPILERLHAVVARGQREGHIDPRLTIDWILAAVLALGHAADEGESSSYESATRSSQSPSSALSWGVKAVSPGSAARRVTAAVAGPVGAAGR